MIEHAIYFIGSFYDVPGWVGLEVKGFANLLGALFLLVTLAEILMAIYDRKKESKKVEKIYLPQEKQERIANTNPAIGTH